MANKRLVQPWIALCLASVLSSVAAANGTPRMVGYFSIDSVYSRDFQPKQIPATSLTHLNYAFVGFSERGDCQSLDTHLDTLRRYPGDTDNDPFHGLFNQFRKLKVASPHLKIIMSIGGGKATKQWSRVANDPIARYQLARSCADFAARYGFDGIDLDWEYPVVSDGTNHPQDRSNYTKLVESFRAELTRVGQPNRKHMLLTAAVAPTAWRVAHLETDKLKSLFDWVNVMVYDLHGAWEPMTNFHSALYPSATDPSPNKAALTVDGAAKIWLKAGFAPDQIVLGVPLFGRSWTALERSNNGVFQRASTTPPAGTGEERGYRRYTDILAKLDSGEFTRYWDDSAKQPWAYQPRSSEFVAYEDLESLTHKADYVKANKLGGLMLWELSDDANGNQSLVKRAADALASGNGTVPGSTIPSSGGKPGTELSSCTEIGVKPGLYSLIARHSGKALDGAHGAKPVQWAVANRDDQSWQIQTVSAGFIRLISKKNNLALASTGTDATFEAVGSASSQQWCPVKVGGDHIVLRQRSTGQVLDVKGSFQTDGTPIMVWYATGRTNQQWQLKPAGTTPPTNGWWKPKPGNSWQWQLSGVIDTSVDAQMFDIDLFETPQATIDALHAKGRKVVCYFSAGSFEKGRPDADRFPTTVLGEVLDGWPDERWLDIRQINQLAAVMTKRLDLAASKQCDGVEPDNIDGYTNSTGFPLKAADQLAYNRWLAQEAHKRGLSIGLKNDVDQIKELEPYYDWALNEQCFQYDECDGYQAFIKAGKAVFGVEYSGSTSGFCAKANAAGYDWLKKRLELDVYRVACRTNKGAGGPIGTQD
ncbi:endo alpha-1,4 polygalactosaminidase [Chitinivorax sp. B]|uniref:endo alpha-1,4 polygalactosaminidase n=1 Tax=Chitinivorax sp. B TaxID=2502235 RepID=UPI0010F86B4F|nr:endo alpha-1,4 polygalactosaminidase [Chitinivorax sp. B]